MYDLAGADPSLRFSPYCWRTKMALAHKGLAVETVPWRFTEKDVIASSGQGRVPVLLDGDKVISDSWEIACYLDEAYADRPALFGSGDAKGAAFFIKRWTEAVVHPALVRLIIADIVKIVDPKDAGYFRETREKALGVSLEDYAAAKEENMKNLHAALLPLRLSVKDLAFLGGAAPSYSDYIVFGALQWARCSSPQDLLPADDPVAAWFDRLLKLYDGLGAKAPRPAAA
ncbi:glutathione S-transferase N-terminal domain-containing protein [Pelagibius sp. CAU 1746]|uniref:glutathione S-transferase N-terminal domain-containing protein n=1 Tax=Pelagibius sp. CAU 1746 TaxID=3140370 RepID=UPI00325B396C